MKETRKPRRLRRAAPPVAPEASSIQAAHPAWRRHAWRMLALYGKGRVCFMAPGHLITALWNPEYEKMQKNAVKWLLRQT